MPGSFKIGHFKRFQRYHIRMRKTGKLQTPYQDRRQIQGKMYALTLLIKRKYFLDFALPKVLSGFILFDSISQSQDIGQFQNEIHRGYSRTLRLESVRR